jgi:hypothetical protein
MKHESRLRNAILSAELVDAPELGHASPRHGQLRRPLRGGKQTLTQRSAAIGSLAAM